MQLTLTLTGGEDPRVVERAMSAMRHFVFGDGPAPAADTVMSNEPTIVDAVANVVAGAAAAPETPKRTRKKKDAEVVEPIAPSEAAEIAAEVGYALAESPETATADHAAVIAEGKAELAEKAAAEVKVEDIRAIAAQFNTDASREIAVGILKEFGVTSVSALAERSNEERFEVLARFELALETLTLKEAA